MNLDQIELKLHALRQNPEKNAIEIKYFEAKRVQVINEISSKLVLNLKHYTKDVLC